MMGCGAGGSKCSGRLAQPLRFLDSLVVGPAELVGEAAGNPPALFTVPSTLPAGFAPVRRTRPKIHRTPECLRHSADPSDRRRIDRMLFSCYDD